MKSRKHVFLLNFVEIVNIKIKFIKVFKAETFIFLAISAMLTSFKSYLNRLLCHSVNVLFDGFLHLLFRFW